MKRNPIDTFVSARANCDLCEGRSFEPIANRDRHGHRLRTVVCRECGLVRHWHVPSEQQLREFYSSHYRQDYHGEEAPSARRIMRAWQNGARIHRLLSGHIHPPARVLEVGAGIGCTVKYFAERGFEACGIEPHRGFQTYASQTLRANVTNQDLFDCDQIGNCDLLLLVHVIEHFRSPQRALQRIHQLIKPGGFLYMECPNLAAPFAVRGRMFHFAHIHNFTPLTLEALAAKNGFERVAWMHATDDPNLAGLWRKATPAANVSWSGSYQSTMEALGRYNWLTYHLRTSYLQARARKLMGYLRERLVARRVVNELISGNRSSRTPGASQRKAA